MDKKKEKLFSHSISSLFKIVYNLKILKLSKNNNVKVYISNCNISVLVMATPYRIGCEVQTNNKPTQHES